MRALLLAALLVAPLPALAASPDPVDVVVGFRDAPPAGPAWKGAEVVRVDEALAFAVLRTPAPEELLAAAAAEGSVRYAFVDSPTAFATLLTPNDARWNDAGMYGARHVNAPAAWDTTLGSTSVKVAVLDTGIRRTHEDFVGGRVLTGYDFVNGDSNPADDCDHGTHVSGTIGATTNNAKGVAGLSQISVLPVKVLGPLGGLVSLTCTGSHANIASGIRYAADQGATVISMSLGGSSGSTTLADAVSYAKGKGVLLVAAAGNDGPCSDCVGYPAKYADVVAVSCTDENRNQCSFSSDGPEVDLSAPGNNILSTVDDSDTAYRTMSGTSMSTPHVAGVAALAKSADPTMTAAQIRSRLESTAQDRGATGWDQLYGWGLVDAAAAVGGAPPPPPPTNQPPVAAWTYTTSGLTISANGASSTDPDGSVVAWSWSWGDGSAPSTGASASHAYAAAGTYTVTLTVTDDDGATDAETKIVTVTSPTDPDPSTPTLQNGVARSDTSGAAGSEKFYKIQVPAGKSQLAVVLDGPACGLLSCPADLDLYVRRAAKPTDATYDCRPYEGDSDESCTLANPAADWWYVRVKVYSGSNGAYTIRASY